MSADFFCLQCRCHFDGDTFIEHRCRGRVTCACCEVNMPTTMFAGHPCVSEHLSTQSTANAASTSTEQPTPIRHPSMRGTVRDGIPPLSRTVPDLFDQGA